MISVHTGISVSLDALFVLLQLPTMSFGKQCLVPTHWANWLDELRMDFLDETI